jgi:hypothetical protein
MIAVDHRISELCAFALVTGLEECYPGFSVLWVRSWRKFLVECSEQVIGTKREPALLSGSSEKMGPLLAVP